MLTRKYHRALPLLTIWLIVLALAWARPAAALPAAPVSSAPPQAQAYVECQPAPIGSGQQTLVPLPFISNALGASAGPMAGGFWRVLYYQHTVDLYPYEPMAHLDGRDVHLPVTPRPVGGVLYVPWAPVAELFGVSWRVMQDSTTAASGKNVFLLQFPAAYIEEYRQAKDAQKLRIVLRLSNPTRVWAAQQGLDLQFFMAASRRPAVATVHPVNDYLVPRAVTRSGNWKSTTSIRMNYSAPVQWFTLGNPPRLVIDVHRMFEENRSNFIGGGLELTKVRKGTPEGPVQMFVLRVDPSEGWRVRVAPGGYSVLKRARPSHVAQSRKALVAVNGGFFANDGAAVGAVMVGGEWIRLPWRGRTAIGFRPDGEARIDNLQVDAEAEFASGLRIPVRDLNGWPAIGKLTALTGRFGGSFKLRPGEMAVVVKDGRVVSLPGGGVAPIYPKGFTLVASEGARPWLQRVRRGETAVLKVQPVGWEGYTSALGGGPRLVNHGRVEVTALTENFRTDVRLGRGPRTAMGIDRYGRYIIMVVDGRNKGYSVGLTLDELAAIMVKYGAVDALNLDGGGSTAMAVRGVVVNRPSDGFERSVSNVLLVMR